MDETLATLKAKEEMFKDLDTAHQAASRELKKLKERTAAITAEKEQALKPFASNAAYSKLEEDYRSDVASLKQEHHSAIEALHNEHSEYLATRQASHTERLQEVEKSYEARLQKSSSCHEQRLEEATAVLKDVICQKRGGEMRALEEANEVDTKRQPALALEAAKKKLSRRASDYIDRLNASLREKEVAHEEDKARMLADHAEGLRPQINSDQLKSQSQRAEAELKAKQSECTKLKGRSRECLVLGGQVAS